MSDARETRPTQWIRIPGRESHYNTSFSSGRGWRGPCFARTVTTVTICCKLWLSYLPTCGPPGNMNPNSCARDASFRYADSLAVSSASLSPVAAKMTTLSEP
jgi:hypothetical protein